MVTNEFKIIEVCNGVFIIKRKYLTVSIGILNLFRKNPNLNEEWHPIRNRKFVSPTGRFPVKEFKSKLDAESYADDLINKNYPIVTLYP